MSARLVVHAWVDISDPWSYIGVHRLLGGIALAQAKDEARIDVDLHAFLGPGRAWEAGDARKIAAVARREGLAIDPEVLTRRMPSSRRRQLHRLVYAAKAQGTDPGDGARRGVQMFMAIQEAVLGGDSAGLAQIEEDAGSLVPPPGEEGASDGRAPGVSDDGRALREGSTAHDSQAHKPDGQTAQEDQTAHDGRARHEWELDELIDRDIADATRMRIGGLPLVVIGGIVSVVGAQGKEAYAELIAEAGDAAQRIDRAPGDAHLRLA